MDEGKTESVEGQSGCGSCGSVRCCCVVTLPQPLRPSVPVDYSKHELLECFPCFYEATWPLQKLPFLKWLFGYRPKWLLSDLIAGLTVGLMVVPQALAYAVIAKLPPVVSGFVS